MPTNDTKKTLLEENRRLRLKMEEFDAARRAIGNGEVDALVIEGKEGEKLLMLKGALEPYRVMVETMNEGAVSLSANGTILYSNNCFLELLRIPRETLIGLQIRDIIAAKDRETFDAMLRRAATEETRGELTLLKSDGTRLPALLSMNPLPESKGKAISVVITNLSEVATAAEARSRLALIVESSDDAIVSIDPYGTVESWNNAAGTLFGYSADEAVGQDILNLIVPPGHEKETQEKLDAIRRGRRIKHFETIRRHKNKTQLHVSVTASPIADTEGNVTGASLIFRDITERKKAEESIQRANRALKMLSAGNMALVRAQSENELLESATRIIVEQAGYSMAVVDYAMNDPKNSIVPMAWSGYRNCHYWSHNLSWADNEEVQLPLAKAIRTKTTQICRDIAVSTSFEPWRETALHCGYVSNIAIPLVEGEKVLGALSIYSLERDDFSPEEVKLLEELSGNLAFGIRSLRARVAQEQHEVLLRQSLEESIMAIAATVEARDPYTSGHQKRVGELATAIALEMKLPEEKLRGIHLAAIIHDVGKIHVPAEILTKPGNLTDLEYQLVQTHPQVGYDILKDVKYPWPIAQIILQHHEKIDGSGYPQGLKGEEILTEAKILTVADAVEAMSSSRPYRPALGINAALEEISQGRGTKYDPAVVDACLRLFAENKFTFGTQP